MPVRSGRDATLNFDKMAKQLPTFVSSLPTQASDGAEVYYQNAEMATQGVVWHLRYRAGSTSLYKWECVGGSVLEKFATGPQKITLAKNDFTQQEVTATPTLTIPLAGDYTASMWIEYVQLAINKHSTPQINVGVGRTLIESAFGTVVVTASIAGPPETSNQFYTVTLDSSHKQSVGAAGEVLKLWCGGNDTTANLWQVGSMQIFARPIRVG